MTDIKYRPGDRVIFTESMEWGDSWEYGTVQSSSSFANIVVQWDDSYISNQPPDSGEIRPKDWLFFPKRYPDIPAVPLF